MINWEGRRSRPKLPLSLNYPSLPNSPSSPNYHFPPNYPFPFNSPSPLDLVISVTSKEGFVFKTHYCRSVHAQQDIRQWKIFPNKVFIAGISCREKRISSTNFHIIEGLGIKKWNAMNFFPINCNSKISLIIINISFSWERCKKCNMLLTFPFTAFFSITILYQVLNLKFVLNINFWFLITEYTNLR